jgi:hypothetical protein
MRSPRSRLLLPPLDSGIGRAPVRGSRKRTSDLAHGRFSPSTGVRSSSAQKKKGWERQRAGGHWSPRLLPLKSAKRSGGTGYEAGNCRCYSRRQRDLTGPLEPANRLASPPVRHARRRGSTRCCDDRGGLDEVDRLADVEKMRRYRVSCIRASDIAEREIGDDLLQLTILLPESESLRGSHAFFFGADVDIDWMRSSSIMKSPAVRAKRIGREGNER